MELASSARMTIFEGDAAASVSECKLLNALTSACWVGDNKRRHSTHLIGHKIHCAMPVSALPACQPVPNSPEGRRGGG